MKSIGVREWSLWLFGVEGAEDRGGVLMSGLLGSLLKSGGVAITAVNGGFVGATGASDGGEMISFKVEVKLAEELVLVTREDGAERAAENDMIGVALANQGRKADGDAGGDVVEVGFFKEKGNFAAAMGGADGGGRGKIFPFLTAFFKSVFAMAGFEGGGGGKKLAVLGEATADAGAQSEVESESGIVGKLSNFVKGGGVGVIEVGDGEMTLE